MAPIDFGDVRLVLPKERGYLTMFEQILAGLEALDTEVVFFAEHDLLYAGEHFSFRPPAPETLYYNQAVWKVDQATGRCLHYRCNQTSGLCGPRTLLVDHYRRRVARVAAEGYRRSIGFEPGTRKIRHGGIDDTAYGTWWADRPNVDIRHTQNLTPSRWRSRGTTRAARAGRGGCTPAVTAPTRPCSWPRRMPCMGIQGCRI